MMAVFPCLKLADLGTLRVACAYKALQGAGIAEWVAPHRAQADRLFHSKVRLLYQTDAFVALRATGTVSRANLVLISL